uniref:Secreted protein n=1 Tax=Strongyloides papillosus TaxID=174720 RepID=A0A0N5B6Z7_STREA
MIFSIQIKQYIIFLISLIELVKFTLPYGILRRGRKWGNPISGGRRTTPSGEILRIKFTLPNESPSRGRNAQNLVSGTNRSHSRSRSSSRSRSKSVNESRQRKNSVAQFREYRSRHNRRLQSALRGRQSYYRIAYH